MTAKLKIADNFNQPYRVVMENDVVDIWLDTLFNTDVFTFQLITNLSYTKVSNYHYKVTCDQLGFQTVKLLLTVKGVAPAKLILGKQIYSNSLLLIVNEPIS